MQAELGLLDPDKARRDLGRGRSRWPRGDWDAEFPIDVFQTGSGTSSNMNANEVIATLASRAARRRRRAPERPRQRLAVSPTTSFPSAIHVAATNAVVNDLIPALRHPARRRWRRRPAEFATVVKSGRTHLMDATPVTLGQEFGGYAAQVRVRRSSGCEATLPRLAELPLGGTAVGTGINTPAGFAAEVIALIAAETGLPLTEAPRPLRGAGRAGRAGRDVRRSCGRSRSALIKIANDLRWMGSGPRAGLGEIALPDLQPGSSIMPGKVNPVIPEAVQHGRARR